MTSPEFGRPLVSIVMPVLNEAGTIERSLDAIDAQTYPRELIEIAVVDGGSSDETTDLVRARSARDRRVRLLGGPGTNTPTAMNVGIGATTGPLVAKVDGHGWVNPDFVAQAVRVLESDPSVACVGGQIVPIATDDTQRAIRLARFSKFGVGGGIYTSSLTEHDTDTVQCGVYRRTVLAAVGDFDPQLQFGEDEEVNHRIRETGARIVFQPTMRFSYVVRPTLRSLYRQYRNYGRARVAVIRKHPGFLRLKHLIPSVLVVAMVAAVVFAAFVDIRLLAIPAVYGVVVVAVAFGLGARDRFRKPWLVAGALLCLHFGYGIGMLAGIGDVLRPSR